MSWSHIHLALNHVPVVGVLLVLLLLAASTVRQNRELERLSYWLLAGLALVSILVYLTGEPAEKLVEGLPGYSEPLVEHHEQVALFATVGMVILGLAAAVGLLRASKSGSVSRTYSKIVLLLGVVVGGLLGWTANLGGQIRHSEIRSTTQATMPVADDD